MYDPSYYQCAHQRTYPPFSLPSVVQLPPPSVGPWSSGILDCHQDYRNSCGSGGLTYALLSIVGMPCTVSCFYSTKLRQQYLLEERPCNDCLMHFLCESCSLCREYRELENRGTEMSLGWDGNVERKRRMIAMQPAVMHGGMAW